MDNNLLTYVLTTPNLDAAGHWWVGVLASFQFELEYQNGADNGATDALSWVPIRNSQETIQSLLEGAIVGVANRGKVRVSEELLEKHECLSREARVQAVKLAPMHIVDWAEAQEVGVVLAACHKWLCIRKDTLLPKQDTLLKKCLGAEAEMEYAPLELVHLDYTSIESTMELNKPPVVSNVLMMTDHFMRYALAVVTKDQTTKTVVKIFYKCFISVFGVPTKLLSDRGANFMSVLVEELCATFGIQKCHTTAYHAQCNGQVECFHQTLFCMIGKLVHDKKAQWEQHLLELLQAYNSTRLAVTGFSPHYLMFGRCPCLPVDYYFPTVSAFECSCHVPAYVAEVKRCFKKAYAEVHLQMNCEAEKQKRYYDRTMSTAQLVPGDVVLMKSDTYQGK